MLHHAATRCNTLQHTVDGIFQNTQQTQGSFAWAQGSLKHNSNQSTTYKIVLFGGLAAVLTKHTRKKALLRKDTALLQRGETHNGDQSALYEDRLFVSLAAVSKI